jgi:hypothetical protein
VCFCDTPAPRTLTTIPTAVLGADVGVRVSKIQATVQMVTSLNGHWPLRAQVQYTVADTVSFPIFYF